MVHKNNIIESNKPGSYEFPPQTSQSRPEMYSATPGYKTPGYRTPGYKTPGYRTPGVSTPRHVDYNAPVNNNEFGMDKVSEYYNGLVFIDNQEYEIDDITDNIVKTKSGYSCALDRVNLISPERYDSAVIVKGINRGISGAVEKISGDDIATLRSKD